MTSPLYKMKLALVRTCMLAFATAFELVSRRDAGLRKELAAWEEGRAFSLGVMNNGPAITLRKEGGGMRYVGRGHHNPKLSVLFKNVDCALFPLTGLMSSDMAYVQHRGILHGNVAEAMQASRAMAIVQDYLLPGFMLKRICKRPPHLSAGQLALKGWVLLTLAPAMIVRAGR